MENNLLTENLEERKHQVEIEKLNIEIDALRRPFSRPSNWVPVLVAAAAVYGAFNQYQNSELAIKASTLKLERQEFNAEKNLAQKAKELEEKQVELEKANEKKKDAEKSIQTLRDEQVKLLTTLNELNANIDESKKATAKLDAQFTSDSVDPKAKEIIQGLSVELDNLSASLDKTIKEQSERITRLISGMNEDSRTIRVHSTNSLINEFQSSPTAIMQTLALFDSGAIEELSADGRINALIFLGETRSEAWNADLIKIAREKITFIEARQSQGIKIGPTTRKRIIALEELLDSL